MKTRRWLAWTAAPLIAALSPPLTALGQSGSASATALAQELGGAGGNATSANAQIEGQLCGSLDGGVLGSANFGLETGVVWTTPLLGTAAPIVFGVTPPEGFHSGGQSVVVHGLNFTAPGAGSAAVSFGGNLAPSATVTSDTTIAVTTPAGHDGVLGNPLGETRVEVQNGQGTAGADDAFLYYPALTLPAPAQLGKPTEIDIQLKPGSKLFLFLGIAIPGISVAAPPFTGRLAIAINPILVVNGLTVPIPNLQLAPQVPNVPAFAGVGLDLQALAVESPTVGSFSNVLHVTLFP